MYTPWESYEPPNSPPSAICGENSPNLIIYLFLRYSLYIPLKEGPHFRFFPPTTTWRLCAHARDEALTIGTKRSCSGRCAYKALMLIQSVYAQDEALMPRQSAHAHTKRSCSYESPILLRSAHAHTKHSCAYEAHMLIQSAHAHTKRSCSYEARMLIRSAHAHTKHSCSYKVLMLIQSAHAHTKRSCSGRSAHARDMPCSFNFASKSHLS